MIPACPSPMCFFNRSDTERTNSSKMLCLMFVCVLFMYICVGTNFVVFGKFWLDDLCAG